jgi:hypothetical protein
MTEPEGRSPLTTIVPMTVGLLVGDDAGTAIAIGGAGVALFGLYIWQRGD